MFFDTKRALEKERRQIPPPRQSVARKEGGKIGVSLPPTACAARTWHHFTKFRAKSKKTRLSLIWAETLKTVGIISARRDSLMLRVMTLFHVMHEWMFMKLCYMYICMNHGYDPARNPFVWCPFIFLCSSSPSLQQTCPKKSIPPTLIFLKKEK